MNLEFVAVRFSQITKCILIAASGRIEARCRWINHLTPATLASAIACWIGTAIVKCFSVSDMRETCF